MLGKAGKAVLCALALALMISGNASALVVGVSDQKLDMFGDPRFAALGTQHARYLMSWDALKNPVEAAELDRWVTAAHQARQDILITFNHSRSTNNKVRHTLPTPLQLTNVMKQLRVKYPYINEFGAWNEGNLCGSLTCKDPKRNVQYWQALTKACPSCSILAAEVADRGNMGAWITQFLKLAGKKQPTLWGLHNYGDVNLHKLDSTKTLLKLVKGRIWLTETGGLAYQAAGGIASHVASEANAYKATRFLFTTVAPSSTRIQRLYYYSWNTPVKRGNWDSGLIAPNGKTRQSYTYLLNWLRARSAPSTLGL